MHHHTHLPGVAGRSPASNTFSLSWRLVAATVLVWQFTFAWSAENSAKHFASEIEPVLKEFCYDCHGDGMHKGKVAFDEFKSHQELRADKDLWLAVLKNTRASLMPPENKPKPSPAQRKLLADWIKSDVFEIDPAHPDPGRLTIRRLNRTEYRNTIRDLMDFDFNTEAEFPADDTGHGFDNIGDVLTLSPMLIEKYLDAANFIVAKAVPAVRGVPAEKVITGRQFGPKPDGDDNRRGRGPQGLSLSYYEAAAVSNTVHLPHTGRYEVSLDLTATERFVDNQFDLNRCRFIFKVNGEELLRREFTREGNRSFHFSYPRDWKEGAHEFSCQIEPLTPDEKQVRSLNVRIDAVTVRGPLEEKYYVRSKNYDRFFGTPQADEPEARRESARAALARFATQAFRRPVDAPTVERFTKLAQTVYSQPGKTFEAGVAQAMVAILASPRFLFREEAMEDTSEAAPAKGYPLIDEYALASRLSYFLWSSMPDDELFRLASEKKLRANLAAQFKRLLADPKSDAFIRNFTGQWLQGRDIESVPIDHRAVLRREMEPDPAQERSRQRFRELRQKPPESLTQAEKDELAAVRQSFGRGFNRFNRFELTGDLRRAMRQELEKYFEYIVREDRSVLELLESNYTFLNKRLAEHYEIAGVEGDEFQRVTLPPDSPRGGILTMAGVLAVTSNPTRTSPVKRGLFILENIFGTPPPPPPPNIPALEDAAQKIDGREPTLRETLAVHRDQPLCSSCHNRMDPLGLAMENFNALGRWRDKDLRQPIDAAGKLITGESFTNIQQMKKVIVDDRHDDFYQCLTEKLLTYALGRGLEYYDEQTLAQLVERLRKNGGRPSALLLGIVESAPFQKTRNQKTLSEVTKSSQAPPRAEIRKDDENDTIAGSNPGRTASIQP